ncbi:MAG TPA: TIGR00645 family protein [Stellaceae bacterium]|nr:TIGR00645 family protein [Stellaceae bacterium]
MNVERIVERVLFASRWLLAPLYLGLGLFLIALAVHFFRDLLHIALNIWMLRDVDVIVAALTLIDLTLVAGLTVMVMLSGYENFVSKLDLAQTERSIAWLGKLDSGTLKLKVAVSIVAISAIQLLKGFMDVQDVPDDKLLWMTIIHLTFVVSALALTVMDRLMSVDHK